MDMPRGGKELKKVPKGAMADNPEFNEYELSKDGKRRKRKKYKVFSSGMGVDVPFLTLIMILLGIGLVALFSASYASSYYTYGTSYHFIIRQTRFAILGVGIMLLLSIFDYHHLHKLAVPIFIVTIILLSMVLIFKSVAPSIAPERGGANRWLSFGSLEFQPSEIAKISLIIMFAHMVSKRQNSMDTFRDGFLPFAGLLAIFAVLIILEKHVSATIIISMIAIVMMFVGGTKPRYIILSGLLLGIILIAVLTMSDKFGYANNRVLGWLDPFNPPEGVDTYQIRQSILTIGSGQIFGVGLGQSRQKYLHLPESQNDFIFAVVCEELGFVGALLIIILFALFIWRGINIALRAQDKFGMMLGLGIMFQVGIQIVLNLCVVTNTTPNTGISLPFFSSGGTALIILLAEMGIMLNISRSANIDRGN